MAEKFSNGKSVLGTLPKARIGTRRNGAAKAKPTPQAVRPGSPPLTRKRAADPPPTPLGAPKGTELVTTAIRATGELAQIGFMLGGQALRRAVDRLPRP